jgi:hypothetical protein
MNFGAKNFDVRDDPKREKRKGKSQGMGGYNVLRLMSNKITLRSYGFISQFFAFIYSPTMSKTT